MNVKATEKKDLITSRIFLQKEEQLLGKLKRCSGKVDNVSFYFLFFVALAILTFFLFKAEFFYFIYLLLVP